MVGGCFRGVSTCTHTRPRTRTTEMKIEIEIEKGDEKVGA